MLIEIVIEIEIDVLIVDELVIDEYVVVVLPPPIVIGLR